MKEHLTKPRVMALRVLAESMDPRESNVTDLEVGCVYWKTARWLIENGYARRRGTPIAGVQYLKLTDAGFKLYQACAEQLELAP